MVDTDPASGDFYGNGPLTDYVALIAKYDTPNNRVASWGWWHGYMIAHTDPGSPRNMNCHVGPFRIPAITYHPGAGSTNGAEYDWAQYIIDYSYKDTLARWGAKGTTNQLLFAEKHIPAAAQSPGTQNQRMWNGGYQLTYNGDLAYNMSRPTSGDANMFAMSTRDPMTRVNADINPHGEMEGKCALGSSHPGTVNFLIGDASVRGISVTTQPILIWRLTNTESIEPVSLP